MNDRCTELQISFHRPSNIRNSVVSCVGFQSYTVIRHNISNNVVLCAAFLAGNYVRCSFNANMKSELKVLCISCSSNVVLSPAKTFFIGHAKIHHLLECSHSHLLPINNAT